MRLSAVLLTCLMLTGATGLAEREPQTARGTSGDTVFRSAVDLVALNVVVTGRDDTFIAGLQQSDFIVMEDGVRQDVSFFATADVPLDLALLLDTSASMTGQMEAVRAAARGFVKAVRGIDRVMIVDVKQTTRTLHPLDGDVNAALAAIDTTEASGGTGIYNGLYVTLKTLISARQTAGDEVRRQAIVVLSDGHDTASLLSFDDVMEIARDAGIATYTINLQPTASSRRPSTGRMLSDSEYALKSLAQETGAQAFFPKDVRDLDGVYGRIATELSNQYALAYVPKNVKTGTFRRISVAVANHPEFRTRTRSGYTG